jgi:hypothetical protein
MAQCNANEIQYYERKGVFSYQKKNSASTVKRHVLTHIWSTKCRRKEKLIVQFSVKS